MVTDTHSPEFKKSFLKESIYGHLWSEKGIHHGICFITVDLAGATAARDCLEKQCAELQLNEKEIFEVSLICDELVANAIVATSLQKKSEYIVLRWKCDGRVFSLSVLDYGGGLDLKQVSREIPAGETLDEFLNELRSYRARSTVCVKNYGETVEHTRFGRGLRIVQGLADKIAVKFHCPTGLKKKFSADCNGSLISVSYNLGT